MCVQAIASTPAFSRRAAAPNRQGRSVVARAADTAKIERSKVPLELEEGAMPMNTYSPKKPFTAKVKSVKRIVGPKVCSQFSNRSPCGSHCTVLRHCGPIRTSHILNYGTGNRRDLRHCH